ncbi:ISL3 family transposase [Planctomycetota bacterium]
MSTSLLYHAFGIRDYRYLRTWFEDGAVTFVVEPKKAKCPSCGWRVVVRHGYRWRRLSSLPIGRRPVFVEIKVPRVHCCSCGGFDELDPPFADTRVTYTHALARYVADLCRVTTIKAAADLTGLSWDIVKSIEKKRLRKLYANPCLRGVRYVAVDEIAVRKGHRYMTLVADLDTGRILHVAEGKDGDALVPFLKRLRRRRTPLKAIAMDMSAAYAAAVRDTLPGVPIVFDRFHVVKLMNERLDELRRAHVRDTEKAHGELVKGVRYLVLMGAEKLDEYEERKPGSKDRLQQALAVNEPLSKGYYLKEKLRLLWEEPDKACAEDLLNEWCAEAEASGVRELKRMAKTVASHRSGILAYFDHDGITSGPLEGINNKVKTLKRMAYGYRDDEFFKLKLLGLHEARYRLIG